MDHNPYEELRDFLSSRKQYLQETSSKLQQFQLVIQQRNIIPISMPIDALTSNNICCAGTLESLTGLVNHLCGLPLTPDTNMATYDLYNRLHRWTELYKTNVADVIDFEQGLLTGVIQ